MNTQVTASKDKGVQRELEELRAECAKLRAAAERTVRMKVSGKGALSLYGLGRFPVTLYREQWEEVLGMSAEIKEFIEKNSSTLKRKANGAE